MIIAIDGPAASGKGTLARRLAGHYRLAHLDTGKLYRALGALALARRIAFDNVVDLVALSFEIRPDSLSDPALASEEVGRAASKVSSLNEIREALIAMQRDFAHAPEGAVLDGRDIGTVICPDADVKLFVEADVRARAQRRWLEERNNGKDADLARIEADLIERDTRDRMRASAPLKAADDAHLLDTSKMDIEAAFRTAVDIVEKARFGK